MDTMTDTARVVKVVLCHDETCPGLSYPHLAVELLQVPLEYGKATAISYTWGGFGRRPVFLGHMHDDKSYCICIELGTDWVVSDVIARLASLSSECPIWLDQLCIRQEPEEIRRTLAKIPAIYRTFDVTVLLPGHPCKCMRDLLEEIDEIRQHGLDPAGEVSAISTSLEKFDQCLNFNVSSSWIQRLWPRQELMYSRHIKCVWASNDEPACVMEPYKDLSKDNFTTKLAPYSASNFRKFLDQGFAPRDAAYNLRVQQQKVAGYGVNELQIYTMGIAEQSNQAASPSAFYEFLGGRQLSNGSNPPDTILDFLRNLDFITQSFRLNRQTRTCTQPRDYVVSVWADCPNYEVPETFKSMQLNVLLQKAMDQLLQKHGYSVLTTAPRGLFDSVSPASAIWHPKTYLDLEIIQSGDLDLRVVYGPIFSGGCNPSSVDGEIMLSLHPKDSSSLQLSATTRSYKTFLEDNAAISDDGRHDIIESLRRAVLRWSRFAKSAIADYLSTTCLDIFRDLWIQTPDGFPLGEEADVLLPLILMARMADDDEMVSLIIRRLYRGDTRAIEGTDWNIEYIHQALFSMMAIAMRLHEGVCRKKGVDIMVSGAGETMRLGFCRGDVDFSSGTIYSQTARSIKMNHDGDETGHGDLIYEAVEKSQQQTVETAEDAPGGTPTFQVFGVWIPLEGKHDGQYNAETYMPRREEGFQFPNAFLN